MGNQEAAEQEELYHQQTVAERGIAKARAALEEAKAKCCPHGVPWRACHQHDGHVVAGEVVNEEAL